jgi:hypothetical protein
LGQVLATQAGKELVDGGLLQRGVCRLRGLDGGTDDVVDLLRGLAGELTHQRQLVAAPHRLTQRHLQTEAQAGVHHFPVFQALQHRPKRGAAGAEDQFFLLGCQVLDDRQIFNLDARHDNAPLRCCAA